MKYSKRLFAFAMTLCMVFSLGMGVFAAQNTQGITIATDKTITLSDEEIAEFVPFSRSNITGDFKRNINGEYVLTAKQFIELYSSRVYGSADGYYLSDPGITVTDIQYNDGIAIITGSKIVSRLSDRYTKEEHVDALDTRFALEAGRFILSATFLEETQPYYYKVLDHDNWVEPIRSYDIPEYTNSILKVGSPSSSGTYVSWKFHCPNFSGGRPKDYSVRVDS